MEEAIETALLTTDELCKYLNVSKPTAVRFGEEAGAKVKMGRSVRWNRIRIDKAIKQERR